MQTKATTIQSVAGQAAPEGFTLHVIEAEPAAHIVEFAAQRIYAEAIFCLTLFLHSVVEKMSLFSRRNHYVMA